MCTVNIVMNACMQPCIPCNINRSLHHNCTFISIFCLQPHPASDQAAASVVASGAQTTIQLPRVHFPDDGAQDASQTYGGSWHDEPLSPVTTVYGEPPPPTLVRQQTFGRVGLFVPAGTSVVGCRTSRRVYSLVQIDLT